ncbi:GlxA family transcriptional regulator [Thalassovita taeanensis]|nr:helix-turn-helix domain-containing protein [Thalassovita taeanensis]
MRNTTIQDFKVALVNYPGAQLAAIEGLADLFLVASRKSMSEGGGQVIIQRISAPLEAAFDAVIFPPSLDGARGTGEDKLIAWAVGQHQRGARLCSVCAGAFWLGHAGLLTGRPVTTHWALEDEFRAAFPAARLCPEHILIDDNDIVTAGGLMAWVDLGLFLVGLWGGQALVSATARHLLVDPSGREQRNYRSFRPNRAHGDAAILNVQHWLEAHPDGAASVEQLAAVAGLSGRTFLRRFQAATGLPPSTYAQQLRVEKARGLLERTRNPVAQIAWAVGYADPSAFARVFKGVTGLSAGEYRRRFGTVRMGRGLHST